MGGGGGGGTKPQRDGNVFFVLYGNNGPGAERTSQASMVRLVALLPPDRRLASSIPYGGTFFFLPFTGLTMC